MQETEQVRMRNRQLHGQVLVESKNTYYLRNISTCCTVIAAYVILRFLWFVWLALEAVSSMPLEQY